MMLARLIYSCATGTFGSRRIEQATCDQVPARILTGDAHPDHDPICAFRRSNPARLSECFVKVLQRAQELNVARFRQSAVSVVGPKVAANASKPAVSCRRAGERIAQLEREVAPPPAKAEGADATPVAEGLKIPAELVRRQERPAALAQARAARQERGDKAGGKPLQAPSPEHQARDQYHFTAPESRILKAGRGQHCEPSDHAQAAVAVASRLIAGQRVSQAPNDQQELGPTVAAIPPAVGTVAAGLTDSGCCSEAAMRPLEQTPEGAPRGTTVDAPLDKTSHHRRVADLEPQPEPAAPAPGARVSEVRRPRLKTKAGRALDTLRQQTVAPGFGILKATLGFRPFLRRGTAQVALDWERVGLAYNFRRLPPRSRTQTGGSAVTPGEAGTAPARGQSPIAPLAAYHRLVAPKPGSDRPPSHLPSLPGYSGHHSGDPLPGRSHLEPCS